MLYSPSPYNEWNNHCMEELYEASFLKKTLEEGMT
jgi:hypothetical protein